MSDDFNYEPQRAFNHFYKHTDPKLIHSYSLPIALEKVIGKNTRPERVACEIMSDLLYWNRFENGKDTPRFVSKYPDGWLPRAVSYYTKEGEGPTLGKVGTVREALDLLVEKGLIHKKMKTFRTRSTSHYKVDLKYVQAVSEGWVDMADFCHPDSQDSKLVANGGTEAIPPISSSQEDDPDIPF